MKALVLALLFLNLAYLGYTRLNVEPGDAGVPADAGPPVPRLMLVGEGTPSMAHCTTVGPFAAQAAAQRAATWLVGAHYGSRLHSADAKGASSYWVAITTKTLQDATRIGLRLRAAGVADLVIMPPEAGATDATVSLGIYSERDRAEHRVADLRRYAVAPVIVEQPHTVTTWWLDVEVAAGDVDPLIGALAKAAGEPGSLRRAACAATPAPAPAPATDAAPDAPAAATGTGPAPESTVPAAAPPATAEPAAVPTPRGGAT